MVSNMKATFDCDIIIIGLGPAGSTFARLIDSSYKVIALDKKTENAASFKKPCGGLISSDAQKALAGFDMTLPKDILVDPQIFSVKTIDLKNNLIRHYQRFYINLDRHKFDLWLRSMIPHNVEVRENCTCKKAERIAGGFKVTFLEDGEEKVLTSKYIIGADGAKSIIRNTFFKNKNIRTYMSIQQWFNEENPKPFYSCIFDKENTDACSWSISKDDYFIFGGAYPKDNARERFENQKVKLQKLGFKFGEPVKTEACLVLRPSSPFSFCCGEKSAFLIGEAAGFISPSSFEGISSAINSAKYLSKIFNEKKGDFNKKYKRKTLKIRVKLFLKVLKCPFMYNQFLRQVVMKSSLKAIKIEDSCFSVK